MKISKKIRKFSHFFSIISARLSDHLPFRIKARKWNWFKSQIYPRHYGILGNLIAIFVVDFSRPLRKWLTLIGRFVCGLGAGSISVIESNLALASTIGERNTAFAIHGGMESFALFVGPGFQTIFVPLGYRNLPKSPTGGIILGCNSFSKSCDSPNPNLNSDPNRNRNRISTAPPPPCIAT